MISFAGNAQEAGAGGRSGAAGNPVHGSLMQASNFSPVNIQMDPPQIATEGFSSDSLSERSLEQHTKNRGKSRRANIIFFGKIQNGGRKHNFVYYSVILKTKNCSLHYLLTYSLT